MLRDRYVLFYEGVTNRRAIMIQLHRPADTHDGDRSSATPEISSRRIFSAKPVYPHLAVLAYLSIITAAAIGDSQSVPEAMIMFIARNKRSMSQVPFSTTDARL